MKKYHEVGVIMDGNKRVGFVMKDATAGKSSPYMLASLEQFCSTVKRGLVQYFVWDDSKDTYKIEYSQEEMRDYTRVGMQPITDMKQYFMYDVHFKKSYVDEVVSGKGILVMPIMCFKAPLVGNVATVVIFASRKNGVFQDFCLQLVKGLKNTWIGMTMQYAKNNFMLNADLKFISKYFHILKVEAERNGYNAIIDCSNLERAKNRKSISRVTNGISESVYDTFILEFKNA